MNFRLSTRLALFLSIGIANAALAEDATKPHVEGRRFGVVNMQTVILAVEEGKEARNELEKEIKSKEGDFRKKKEELDALNKEWRGQASMLSEEARNKKQQDFQEKFVGLRNAELEFQNQIKQKEAQATQRIAMNVTKLVDDMARKQNLEIVFEVNSSGLLYVKNPVDLTEQVIKRYDANKGNKKTKAASDIEAKKNSDDKKL